MPDELLFEGGAYTTAPEKGWALLRAFPSFFFYCQDSVIVLKATWRAKRGRYDTAAWVASSRDVLRALENVGVTFEITGIDNVRELAAPAVFIGNHMSVLETFVLPAIIAPFRDTTFVVKQSLVEYPVFKHVMRSRDPVTVTRTNPREDLRAVLEGGEQRLKAGISIVVFPQTTRMVVFDPMDFNSIGVKLAKKAGAPIVPIALKTDAWGNGRYLKDFGKISPSSKVRFAFGKPLWVRGRGREEHEEIVRFISAKLTEWST
jgi:1-acyl-sn-glycerol-3-phosphate acyltransferase